MSSSSRAPAPGPSPAPAPAPSPSASASASASPAPSPPAPSPSPSSSAAPSPQPTPPPQPSPSPSPEPPAPSPSPSSTPAAASTTTDASSSSAAPSSTSSATPVLGTPVASSQSPAASPMPSGVNVRPANGGNVSTLDPSNSTSNSAGSDSTSSGDSGMSAGAVTALVIVPLALAGVLLGLFVARWRRTQRRRQFASVPMSMLHARNVDGGNGSNGTGGSAGGSLPAVKPFAPNGASASSMLPPASGQVASSSMAGTMVYVPIAEPKTADRQQQMQEYQDYPQQDQMGYPQPQQGYAAVSQHHLQPTMYDTDEVQFPVSSGPLPPPLPTASAAAPIVPTSGPFAPRHVPIGPLGQGYTGPTTPGAHAVIPAGAAADLPPLPPHMQPVPQQMPQSVTYRAGPMVRQSSLEGQGEGQQPQVGLVQPVSPGYQGQ